MRIIEDYIPIVGRSSIDELFLLADQFKGKTIQNVNSTAVGGGVAEILMRMVPLLKQLGVNVRWDVIKGNDRFFIISKTIFNGLHGGKVSLLKDDIDYFLEINKMNAETMELGADVMFIHDPQPIALIEERKFIGGHWAWRCHIDFSKPDTHTWNFLKNYIEQYDAAVLSAPSFARHLKAPQVLISPSIDPLSDKNRDLSQDEVTKIVTKFSIDTTRPIITQISRFDYVKDPIGVIKAYRKVKKYLDVQLILAGGGASDDPEGMKVLEEVRNEASKDADIHILYLPPASDLEINALQRISTLILQKSLKEGFGLTVSEALWKAKPVIATATGGIPLQIKHKYSGILTHTIDGTAYWIKQLIQEPKYAAQLGLNGREHIKNNYLITRHIKDYLLLFLSMMHKQDLVFLE